MPDYKVKLTFNEDNTIKDILLINDYGVLLLSETDMILNSIKKRLS